MAKSKLPLWKKLQIKRILFNLWLNENKWVFVRTGLVVLCIFALLGRIYPDTPIIGTFFGEISQKFASLFSSDVTVEEKIEKGFLLICSLAATSTLFMKGLRKISAEDFTEKVKAKLVKYGYFSEESIDSSRAFRLLAHTMSLDNADTHEDENIIEANVRTATELGKIMFTPADKLVDAKEITVEESNSSTTIQPTNNQIGAGSQNSYMNALRKKRRDDF